MFPEDTLQPSTYSKHNLMLTLLSAFAVISVIGQVKPAFKSMFNGTVGDATDEYEETKSRKKKRNFLRDSIHPDLEEVSFENLRSMADSIQTKKKVKEFDLYEKVKQVLEDHKSLKQQKKNLSSCVEDKGTAVILPSECLKEKKPDNEFEKKIQAIGSRTLDMMEATANHIAKTMKKFMESLQEKKIVNKEKVKSCDIKKIDEYTSATHDSLKEDVLPKPSQNIEQWLKIIRSDEEFKKLLKRFFMLYSIGITDRLQIREKDVFHKVLIQYLKEFSSDMSSRNPDNFFEDGWLISSKDTIKTTEGSLSEDHTGKFSHEGSLKDDALPKPSQNFEKWLKIIRSDDEFKKALERYFMLYSIGFTNRLQIREKDAFHKALIRYIEEFSLDLSSRNPDDFFEDGSIISSKDTMKSTEGSWWSEGHPEKSFRERILEKVFLDG